MKVVINQEKCNGAGICVQELPDVFRFQVGSKKGIPIDEEVSPALADKLHAVAAKCPTGAILVLDK